jgi:hypothetical protein
LPDLLRRAVALTVLSALGIALLAPLAARSAAPAPVELEDRLLAVEAAPAPAPDIDRGSLSARSAATSLSAATDAPEQVVTEPAPTPGEAPMQATLLVVPTPPPAPVAVAPAPQRVVTYDGDTVWDDLAQCESGGNWAINTGNGYYGGLQFSYPTWHGYDGGEFAEYPHEATREEQIIVAERLHAARGFQPWPACRIKLGLP